MLKLLSLLMATLIVLAFTLRAVIPDNLYLPGGWPWGSHWYRANWVAFWFFLLAGIAVGLILIVKIAMRGQPLR